MAVEVARNLLKENEDWDIAIVNDNTKEGRQDSVKYLYKKKKTK
jgi:predicted nucleotidyltransferase